MYVCVYTYVYVGMCGGHYLRKTEDLGGSALSNSFTSALSGSVFPSIKQKLSNSMYL